MAGIAALIGGNTVEGVDYLTDSLGALLLFLTNFIAISTAAALVSYIVGFRPTPSKARREVQRRSSVMALTSLVVVGVVLGITS